MNATAIIVTRNRRHSLESTLRALGNQKFPESFRAELLIIDNGSSVGTPEIIPKSLPPFSGVRLLHHPTPGQAAGRNLALRHAHGTIIAFLDDDVLPPPNWLALLCAPIAADLTDAAAGQVVLAQELLRPWMTPLHRAWLAETDWLNDPKTTGLVGASMAFHRRVLDRVEGFCEALGPGALGFGDDQLFAWQLAAAGFRIAKPTAPAVVHHPESRRLLHGSWLAAAKARGKSQAWLGRHWFGWKSRLGPLRLRIARKKLAAWQRDYPVPDATEGASPTELLLTQQVACLESLTTRHNAPNSLPAHAPA